MLRRLAVAAAVFTTAALTACNVNEYCLDCIDAEGSGVDASRFDGGGDANDGGVPPDACIPTGNEVCDGLDNDCDGTADDSVPTVGDPCGVNMGQCTTGITECIAGDLSCSGTAASPEECDDVDNDCDGVVDDGNPEGGARCGSDVGECIAGTTMCIAGGVVDCVGDVGTPGTVAEICDGRDNDCDTDFDEDVTTQGPCGPTEAGECDFGTRTCVGGQFVCLGYDGPVFEVCDNLDQDCDGNNTNTYDLVSDVRNCGACNNSCIGTITNSTEICSGSTCAIGVCDPGWHNHIGMPGPDCLYDCDIQGPVEACNLEDDDCDGATDEGVNTNPPDICDPDGACAGTTAVCTASGYDCTYTGDVQVDANGDLLPETQCDGVDNDCDGEVDEGDPTVGDLCPGAGTGECQSFGHLACNPANQNGPPICVIDDPGLTPPGVAELCDNLDNNCDGTIDNGATTGALQDWVNIADSTGAGRKQIMKYEASRPDATATSQGTLTTYACSRAGVEPWTLITQPAAETLCTNIGGRLCTEAEWHQACAVVTPTTYPIQQAMTGTPARILIEAEDYFQIVPNTAGTTLRTWVPDYTAGYSGISAMRASPNNDGAVNTANAPTQAPRLEFRVNFTRTGNHRVFVRMYSPDNDPDGDGLSNDDQVHIGISATPGTTAPTRTLTTANNNVWEWRETGDINVAAVGIRTVSIYMSEDGVKVDAIAIDFSNSGSSPTTVNLNGGDWAYETNPDTYAGGTCNGADLGVDDTTLTGPAVGRTSCFANGATTNDAYDMSGNVKEWTAQRKADANPIRGGAFNNEAGGTSCSLAFTLADDDFFFNNVGFRCCRTVP